ncbi:FKBP-type peptidyl-prolyl cis-trans isomerase [Hymenobacter rubidus]|uniref:FKBP-type peptidyl-prolyl cis-trans isomerase n=1 Tax=Hymenobacter rubidus TaxID=1441626 RepID=UPI00191D37B4|nr:FKBP-type peptidyl-prolyl cis-trans isomerase [Hymenobacter rubidus]
MKNLFSASLIRTALFLLPLTAGLLTTACKKTTKSDEEIIKEYLDTNKITNAQRQSSGLYYVPTLTDATQVQAVAGKTVSVLYTGMLMDGTVFDASAQHGNVPISFVLGRGKVIAGWDEGIALMHKGDKAQLLIPSALGYGSAGAPPSIPGDAVLRFQVELVDVK